MSFNKESFENMKQRRDLPFLERNMKVEVDGKAGKVTGNYGHNLLVKYPDCKQSFNCHPHWRTKYFAKDGSLIKEY